MLVVAVAGALVVAGGIGLVLGLRRRPVPVGPVRSPASLRRLRGIDRRTRLLAVVGVVAGVAIALVTGWMLALILVPAAVLGLPFLLSTPASASRVDRLEALEEWTRALASLLTAGSGLEQALIASARSAPAAIRPDVARLASRLRARWHTEAALRQFADDLDDLTGDMIAGNLILAARRRGSGVASVLESLAESVAADVRAGRDTEADRAKPRSTARWVTLISLAAPLVLMLPGTYVSAYASPVGQVVLLVLVVLYVVTLIWLRQLSVIPAPPRFIGAAARAELLR